MPTTTLTTSHWPSAWRSTSWSSSGESLPTSSRAITAGNRVWSSARRTSCTRCVPRLTLSFANCEYHRSTAVTLTILYLHLPMLCVAAGCNAVRIRVQGHWAGRGAAGLVPTGKQEGVLRCLPVHLLRPVAARCCAGDRLEAQHHGLFNAILHSGHEGVPQQGGSALLSLVWGGSWNKLTMI